MSAASCNNCTFQDTQFLAGSCGATFTLFMGLVEYLMSSKDDIADSCNRPGRESVKGMESPEYDFVVVGAGIAGSVVASRLSENPAWKVLLIEAGPEEPTATSVPAFAVSAVGSELDWKYQTQPEGMACLVTGGICNWPRGKMVSGTGGMQGMMYTRGNPKVYNEWAKFGNEGWRYEDVLPYFIRAEKNKNPELVEERYHGTEGPLVVQHFPYRPPFSEAIVEAGKELGYRTGDLNGANQTGIAIAQMMVDNGLRGSTSRMYLRKAGARDNLDVLINSHVTQILIDKKTNLATGVEFIQKDGVKKIVRAKKEVILSGGAIGSPQILLLSGVGPSEDLEELGIEVVQDLPVGRNLHNHVSASVGFYVNDTSYETLTTKVLQEYLDTHKGPLSATGITQTTAFLLSKYASDGVPDIQVFFDGFMATCSRTGLDEECTNGEFGDCGRRYITARPTNILPKSRGYLKLRSTNPKDHPLIFPNYFSAMRDAEVLIEGMKLVIQLTETESLQGWGAELDKKPADGCEGPPFGSDEYWQCVIHRHTGPENHQAGSCKMGPAGDPTAVVDPQLRVHGVRNIRVIDASIFPYVPNCNTIAVVVMVAEKGSDMLKNTWESSEKADNACHKFGICQQCDMNSNPTVSRSVLQQ